MKYGKAFGAVKTSLIRLVRNGGYSPERTQISVFKADRTRLRRYCRENGGISMMDAVGRLLDAAKVKGETSERREGSMKHIVDSIRYKAKEFDNDKLIARIKSGEFDDYIFEKTKDNR